MAKKAKKKNESKRVVYSFTTPKQSFSDFLTDLWTDTEPTKAKAKQWVTELRANAALGEKTKVTIVRCTFQKVTK